MINISKPNIGKEEIEAVARVLMSGNLSQGEVVQTFEKEFAKYCGTKYAVAVNSGTAAIHGALYAMGIKKGDEVITTPFTFIATASPILMLGAKPVFADISEKDFNIDLKEIERKITKKTKAIIAVDLFGKLCDYERLEKLAKKHNIMILEDACQAVGASDGKRRAGNFGDAAAFSFYATKNMMCGEGGMITTNSKKIYEKCKMFRHHGQTENINYDYLDVGHNHRMTDLMASIANEQLKKLEGFNKKRAENAKRYNAEFNRLKGVVLPEISNEGHSFNHYTIRITAELSISRDKLVEELNRKNIGCGIYYSRPLHLFPMFKKIGYKEGDFPVAERLSKTVLSIPVHPLLEEWELEYIIEEIRKYERTE